MKCISYFSDGEKQLVEENDISFLEDNGYGQVD